MNPTLALFWQRYGLTALLGLAVAGAVGAIGVETEWGKSLRLSSERGGRANRPAEIVATLPVFSLNSANDHFKESLDRPLFSPSRRPPPPATAANVVVMKKGLYKLAGTSVSTDLSVAYLVEVSSNKTLRVAKGAEVLGNPGVRVETVDATRVVLKQGDDTEVIELRTAASPPKPAAPLAAPQPVPGQQASGMAAGTPPPAAVVLPPRPNVTQQVPLPGYSSLPGFVAGAVNPGAAQPSAINPGAQPSTANTDPNAPAQRRRRFQNVPQQ